MKTYLVFFLSLFLSSGNLLLSQQLEVGPVTRNTHISHTKGQLKLFGNTFDSTFVFVPDTIQLPVFDDFQRINFNSTMGILTLLVLPLNYFIN